LSLLCELRAKFRLRGVSPGFQAQIHVMAALDDVMLETLKKSLAESKSQFDGLMSNKREAFVEIKDSHHQAMSMDRDTVRNLETREKELFLSQKEMQKGTNQFVMCNLQ
jgi:hypothetical protein